MDPSVDYCKVSSATQGSGAVTADARYTERGSEPLLLKSRAGNGKVSMHKAVDVAVDDVGMNEWREEVASLFAPLSEHFAVPEAILFANLDAVYKLSGRAGGYFAASEMKAYKVFCNSRLCIGALNYFLYRIPTAEFGLYMDRLLLPRWVDEMYWMPPFEPISQMTEEEIGVLILDRFKERIDLIVADESYPLNQIDKVLIPDGALVVILLQNEGESLEAMLKRNKSFMGDMARSFREFSVLVPLALLGRGAVLVGKSPELRSVSDSDINAYIKQSSVETGSWKDAGVLIHSEALKCWNIC